MLRYTIGGQTRKEVFGWETEGKTAVDAERKIADFRANAAAGEGPTSLREEREIEELRQRQEELQTERFRQEEEARNLTLDSYFYGDYLEAARVNKKERTVGSEEALYEKWIKPLMGAVPIREILPWHFQQLKARILKGDQKQDEKTGKIYFVPKSPRTVHYCVSIVTQIWNMAFENQKVDVQPPRRRSLNLPMIDNERTRAFTVEQAQAYFQLIKKHSPQWHDISAASLFCGLRASEVFRLEVKDFDEERGRLFLRTPKKQRSQSIILNESAMELFRRLKAEKIEEAEKADHSIAEGLFFTSRKGEPIVEVSNTVQRVIDNLGFNEGVTDRRDKLTFHSWRHTYATWLMDQGTDIYTISQLLRHSSLAMTKKYTHPQEERLREATRGLDKVFSVPEGEDSKRQEGR